jgi:hypothetical protein
LTTQPTPHDFQEQLAYSHAASAEPFWDKVYHKAFPDMVMSITNKVDGPAQRAGIDRYVQLINGSFIRIDEKKRTKVYNDILLEYISNDRTGAPGWIEKQLKIDYIAYAFMPIQRVYLYPWLMLRRVWLHYRDEWFGKYKPVPAHNPGYITWSLPIPIKVLQQVMRSSFIIQLGVEPDDEDKPEPDDLLTFAEQALGALVTPHEHDDGHYTQLDLF